MLNRVLLSFASEVAGICRYELGRAGDIKEVDRLEDDRCALVEFKRLAPLPASCSIFINMFCVHSF